MNLSTPLAIGNVTPPLRTKILFDGKSASLEDFGGGDALVEEMLDDGAGDGGKQEFGGEGEAI